MNQLAIDFELPLPALRGAPRMQGLSEARAAGVEGAARAQHRAERDEEGFSARAQAFIVAYLSSRASASGEEITLAARAAGITPADDRAFGGIYGGLARRGAIVQCGDCLRVRGNGTSGGRVWKLGA